MLINKKMLARYNDLEIIKKTIDNQEGIEFYYSNNFIYNSNDKRANLFFLFNTVLFIGGPLAIYSVFEFLCQLLDDVIIAFNTIIKEKNFNKQQSLNDHIVFGLYIVYSTVLDFLFGLSNNSIEYENKNNLLQLEESSISVKIKEIRKEYQKKRRKIEERYLDKLNFEEKMEINKEMQNSVNYHLINIFNKNDNSFESYQKNKNFEQEMNQDYESFYIDSSLLLAKELREKINIISQIVDNENYLITTIKNNTPSILNIYLGQIIYAFPLFKNHYKVLKEAKIIEEGLESYIWNGTKASLTEYFSKIFLEYSYLENNDQNEKIEKIPWSILERTFIDKKSNKMTDLKNSYTSSKRKLSKHYEEISKLLKI